MMGSATLTTWAQEHGFWDPEKDGPFNFSKAYTRDDGRDRVYNDPRVWVMQKYFNPSIVQRPMTAATSPFISNPKRRRRSRTSRR